MKKLILLLTFFIIIISSQSSYSKPVPPGSGAGDVPANILFLLDNSKSMNVSMSAPGTSVGHVTDLVQLSDGNIIIAEGSKLIKMSLEDVILDTSFAGGSSKFVGANSDPDCSGKDSKLIPGSVDFLEISNKVNGYTGDVIFALSSRNKIVMINSSGVCLDVIIPGDLHGRNYEIKGMEMRTIDDEDHLFVVGRGPTNPTKSLSYLYTKNLTTGISKACFTHENAANTISSKMKNVKDIAVDDGNNIYVAHKGNIYRYALTEDADGNYCADKDASDTTLPNIKYEQADKPLWPVIDVSDCDVIDRHCFAFYIDIDPDDPSIMYTTTGGYGVVQKLEITPDKLIPMLADKWKGEFNSFPTLSDESVHFKKTYGIHVTSTHVWIMDNKPSIQYFEKDGDSSTLTWAGNFAPMIRRIDGAVKAIKAVVTDSSFTAGANFGYGYWNSGMGDNPNKVDVHTDSEFTNAGYYCHQKATSCPHCNQNCDYFHGWTGSHPDGTSTLCNINSCLIVGVHRDGHNKIVDALNDTDLGWGTDGNAFSDLALDYFSDPNVNVIDPTAEDCQLNYVIVITDGDWMNHDKAEPKIVQLRNNKKVKTLIVAYGTSFSASGKASMASMAISGSCDDASGAAEECEGYIEAATPEDLKTQLASKVQQIIADKLSFTAPSVTATIQEGGSLYQAQFNYVQHREWEGTILRKTLNTDGTVNHDPDAPGNWDAAKEIKAQTSRNIWTVLPDVNYIGEWNNFKTENNSYINHLFTLTGNKVLDVPEGHLCCGSAGTYN